ncbi:MAG: hypothetical protein NTV36_02730 [Candidatus Staskawiczbacteria bacterium]|nr:hypothetical protein [Candidatus Staskawiczbacteria bacterium]
MNFNKIFFVSGICVAGLIFGFTASAQTTPSIQTNSATSVQNNSATLNATISDLGSNAAVTIWFQWGTTTSYGNETTRQDQNLTGSLSQNVTGLASGTTYHFRVASQNRYGIVYGQDMTFYTNGNETITGTYYGNGSLIVTKKVINLTSGNLNWQPSVNANPGDILSFAITLQASNHDIHNVFVQDTLSPSLIFRGNLTINAGLNTSVNPATGINLGTIPAGGIQVIAYQAQVTPANANYGSTVLTNNVTVTSSETGSQTASSSVIMNYSYVPPVYGPTIIATGLTNDPIKDSFFLPILLIMLGSWLYFSGRIYLFADWLDAKL